MRPFNFPFRFAAVERERDGKYQNGETSVSCLMKRIVVSLIVAILLAAAASPAVKAQDSSKDASAERERLRRIMDPGTDVEEFRRELDSFYADLQASANTMLESEFVRDLMARAGLDPLGQLANARKMIPEMTAQDLGVLKAA